MEDQFLEELDKHFSYVNTDKVWKRTVGGRVLWISPIDYTQQAKVTETIQKAPSPHTLMETKRVTLSFAIVGIDGYDLREYRRKGKSLKVKGKDGKHEIVDLPGFVYAKMANWDSDFIDVAFDVFADLMETHRKETLGDLKFENSKDPREELLELEPRVHVLREQLGMPSLVEAKKGGKVRRDEDEDEDGGRDEFTSEDRKALEEEPEEGGAGEPEERQEGRQEAVEDFNPFRPVRTEPEVQAPPQAARRPSPEPPEPVHSASKTPNRDPWPESSVGSSVAVPVPPSDQRDMSPIERELAARSGRPPSVSVLDGDGRKAPSNTPETAHRAQPSVDVGVLEKPADKLQVQPPKINPSPAGQSRNPRFARPQR